MRQLILPSAEFFEGFVAAEKEYRAEGRRQLAMIDIASSSVADILGLYADFRAGRGLKTGLVPATVYWLIDGDEFLGHVSIRHRLNESLLQFGGHIGYMIRPSARRSGHGTILLRLALPKAWDLGIERALVTCDKTNIGSRKIIEASGGLFESELAQGAGLPPKLRYWIDTAPARRRMIDAPAAKLCSGENR